MAIVKYGSTVTEIKGKLGGTVFQRCGQSLSIRVQQSQIKPTNTRNYNTRNGMRILAAAWRAMSTAQKLSFVTNAPSYPTNARFGGTIVLYGYQLYTYINRVVQLVSSVPIVTCASYVNIAGYVSDLGVGYIGAQSLIVGINPAVPALRRVLIYVSALLPRGTQQVPTKLRFCGAIVGGSVGNINIYAMVMSGLDRPPVAGDNLYILLRTVSTSSGLWADEVDDIFEFMP